MKFPFIDEYITTFKECAREVGYPQGNNETMQLFLKGLSKGVLQDIMRPPMPITYNDMKQKAIESTRLQQTLNNLLNFKGPVGTFRLTFGGNVRIRPVRGP